jgi:hypothetical protein
MAELSTSQPLFPGDSDIDQLYIVQKMLGEHQIPQYGCAVLLVFAACCQHSAVYCPVPRKCCLSYLSLCLPAADVAHCLQVHSAASMTSSS